MTLGDYLRVCRQPGFDAKKSAFLMMTAHGPCRFGQYAPYLRRVLQEAGYGDAPVISPTSEDGYEGIGDSARELIRTAWAAIVLGDLLTRFVLKTRPYETVPGDTDAALEKSLAEFAEVLERPGLKPRARLRQLVALVETMRDRFRAVPARYTKDRPLIGLVGEIFCRLNTFSNQDVARRIERLGGECWISDVSEWLWYTNWWQEINTARDSGRFSLDMLKVKIKTHVQHSDEHMLLAPVHEDLVGYEEPASVSEVLELSQPYLPPDGSLGEMVLSVGKSIYLHGKGADGILDISPFTCMNGIICEAIYPAISAAYDDMPMRMAYFDGINTDIDRDLEIFLELARSYQRRKKIPRVYPAYFE